MVVGVVLRAHRIQTDAGTATPEVRRRQSVQRAIAILIRLMITPMMMKADFGSVRLRRSRPQQRSKPNQPWSFPHTRAGFVPAPLVPPRHGQSRGRFQAHLDRRVRWSSRTRPARYRCCVAPARQHQRSWRVVVVCGSAEGGQPTRAPCGRHFYCSRTTSRSGRSRARRSARPMRASTVCPTRPTASARSGSFACRMRRRRGAHLSRCSQERAAAGRADRASLDAGMHRGVGRRPRRAARRITRPSLMGHVR
jgi:hypothetical protein